MRQPQVVVVGAGLAGSLLASLLGQRSINTLVLEARRDPRQHGSQGGRSINLALSTRGRTALARAGLETAVVADGMPMAARLMHDRHGQLTRQPYAKDERQAILSVGRAQLNATLLDAAAKTPCVEFRFEQKVTGLRDDGKAVLLGDETIESDLRDRNKIDIGTGKGSIGGNETGIPSHQLDDDDAIIVSEGFRMSCLHSFYRL